MQVSCRILAAAAAIICCIRIRDVSSFKVKFLPPKHPPSHASYAVLGSFTRHGAAGAILSNRVIVTAAEWFWEPRSSYWDQDVDVWKRPRHVITCLVALKIAYWSASLYRHRCFNPYDKYKRNNIGLVVTKARMDLKKAKRKTIPICDGSGDYTQATILHHQGSLRTKVKGPGQMCYKALGGKSSSCQGALGEPLVAHLGTASECLLGIVLMGRGHRRVSSKNSSSKRHKFGKCRFPSLRYSGVL